MSDGNRMKMEEVASTEMAGDQINLLKLLIIMQEIGFCLWPRQWRGFLCILDNYKMTETVGFFLLL